MTTDISTTESAVTTAVSAAVTEEGRITTTTSAITTAVSEINLLKADPVGTIENYFFVNPTQIRWEEEVNAVNHAQGGAIVSSFSYATFCVEQG